MKPARNLYPKPTSSCTASPRITQPCCSCGRRTFHITVGTRCSCCSHRLRHITRQAHILSLGYFSGPQQGYADGAGLCLQSTAVAAPEPWTTPVQRRVRRAVSRGRAAGRSATETSPGGRAEAGRDAPVFEIAIPRIQFKTYSEYVGQNSISIIVSLGLG